MTLASLLDPRTFKKVLESGITIYTFFNHALHGKLSNMTSQWPPKTTLKLDPGALGCPSDPPWAPKGSKGGLGVHFCTFWNKFVIIWGWFVVRFPVDPANM